MKIKLNIKGQNENLKHKKSKWKQLQILSAKNVIRQKINKWYIYINCKIKTQDLAAQAT